jgi:competence protein ComEC
MRGRPLVVIAGVFALGIWLGPLIPLPPAAVLGIALVVLAAAGLMVGRGLRQSALALLLGVVLTGALAESVLSRPGPRDISRLVRRTVTVEGTVVTDPEQRADNAAFMVAAERATMVRPQPVTGRLRVVAAGAPRLSRGDRVRFTGRLRHPPAATNPGEFSLRDHLARRHIFAQTSLSEVQPITRLGRGHLSAPQRLAGALRARVMASLRASSPKPYGRAMSQLLGSLLFGVRSSPLPQDLADIFRRTGLIHVFVVSGSQVSLLFLLVFLPGWLGERLRRRATTEGRLSTLPSRIALPAVILLIGWYALMTEGGQSVWRAAIMAAVGGLALFLQQTPAIAERHGLDLDRLTLLAAAALVILAFNPPSLFDPGFQLSFAAVWGIIALAPRFQSWLGFLPRWLSMPAAMSVAAQLATAPLLAWHFHAVPINGFLANVVVVPLAGVLLVLGLVAGLLGMLWSAAAAAVGTLTCWLMWVLVQVARDFSSLPSGVVMLGIASPLPVAIYFGLLGLLASAGGEPRRRMPRERVALLLLAIAVATVWYFVDRDLNRTLRVTFFDVGEGESILIQPPSGEDLLIDGGTHDEGAGNGPDVGERVIVPGLLLSGVRSLSAVVLTHPHEDHVNGLDTVLEELPVKMILDTRQPGGRDYQRFRAIAQREHVPVRLAQRGETFNLGNGIHAQVLAPLRPLLSDTGSDINNNGIVIRLTYGRVSFLFTDDIEAAGEAQLLAADPDLASTILKVPHHGSDSSSTPAFLRAVRPRVAVISVGERNPFGHPAARTLAALRARGARILRTDVEGAITIETDGRTWRCRGGNGRR